MNKSRKGDVHHKTGPKGGWLKIDAPWRDTVKVAIKKKKPETGWPTAKA